MSRLLYLEGDPCAPKYVAGALRAAGHALEVVQGPHAHSLVRGYEGYIVSDYEARVLGGRAMELLLAEVEDGAGLLMVGGWRSFGRGGYAHTALGDALPVRLEEGDDRVNLPMGCYLAPAGGHPLTAGLPWDDAPVLTGHNRVEPKQDAEVVLVGWPVVELRGLTARLAAEPTPLLALGSQGRGRVAALATDLAPHWSGGWTDWGAERVPVGEGEEVGSAYLGFLDRLASWLAGSPLAEASAGGVRR